MFRIKNAKYFISYFVDPLFLIKLIKYTYRKFVLLWGIAGYVTIAEHSTSCVHS